MIINSYCNYYMVEKWVRVILKSGVQMKDEQMVLGGTTLDYVDQAFATEL